jgi:hypothetical protein
MRHSRSTLRLHVLLTLSVSNYSNILCSTLLVFSLFRRVVYASATLVTDFTRSLQHLANHGS